jgi:hypothetical protein
MICHVFKVVSMQVTLWDVASFSHVEIDRCFTRDLMMGVVSTYETSVNSYHNLKYDLISRVL